jgi:hypothetical protein
VINFYMGVLVPHTKDERKNQNFKMKILHCALYLVVNNADKC